MSGRLFPAGFSPRAVAFDCDGTLVDSEAGYALAQRELFARRGMTFDHEHEHALFGRAMPDKAALLAAFFGEHGNEAAIDAELTVLAAGAIAATATSMPGARDLVEAARATVPIALVSNSPRALIDASLASAGLAGLFTVIIAADTAPRPKPAPDPYLAACTRLGVIPALTLAVEDSAVGLRSARAAGLTTLAVPSLADQELDADATIHSLLDPEFTGWVQGWAPRPSRAEVCVA